MPETAKRTARVPILGEDGRISDDYIPAAIGEGVESAEAAATRAETAATSAEGSATAASQSAAGAKGSASAASASASQAQESAAAASGAATQAQSAQQAAEAAKTGAESARDSAQTAASQAQQSATEAAQSAASVADKFISSAQATTLDPGSQATASVEDQVLTIGVPKGDVGEQGPKGDTGEQGEVGPQGPKGDTPTVGIGTVETLPAGSSATASATTTDTGVNISFGIPRGDKGDPGEKGDPGDKGEPGDKGDPGEAATVTVGATTTGEAGTEASVTNSGSTGAAVLNFTIPRGDKGDKGDTGDQGIQGEKGDPGTAATIAVGSVTGLAAGASPTVVNSGTANVAVLDFGIPKGEKGDQGPQGEPGQDGQDATLPEGMVTADDSGTLSRLGDTGETSLMDMVAVGNVATDNYIAMNASGVIPSIGIGNAPAEKAIGMMINDGEPVLSVTKSHSDTKVYFFSTTIPEDDTLTVVTSDAYKADTDPLKQRISELEQQTQNVVTGTSTGLVAHGEDAYAQKPREVRIKGKTWVNRWPVIEGTQDGLTIATDETGLITVSGTATATGHIRSIVSGLAENKSISAVKSGGTMVVQLQAWNAGAYVRGVMTVNTSASTANTGTGFDTIYARINYTSGETYNASFRIMLVDGTKAPDCFTPPASITSVQPENLVTSGKNVLDISGAVKDGWNVLLPNARLVSGETYTYTSPSTAAGAVALFDTAENFGLTGYLQQGRTQTFTVPASCTFKSGISLAGASDSAIVVGDELTAMVELGSTATAYEPPTVTTTPLPEVELRSLPNGTCDELVIKADGTCEVERRTAAYQVQGTENWNVGEHATGQKYVSASNLPIGIGQSKGDNILCDKYASGVYSGSTDKYAYIPIAGTIVINDSRFIDSETAKQILASEKPLFLSIANESNEPQSPVTLPALPAPTFNQYHDASVPSDTSTEYARDINIVIDKLQAQISATTVREATNG